MTTAPTVDGYISFIRNVMGINSTILPDASPAIQWSYQVSLRWVNTQLQWVTAYPTAGAAFGFDANYPSLYALAVYNLAGDRLVNYAHDLPDAPMVAGSDLPFFQNLRASLKLNAFVAGAITSAGDEGTSASYAVPKAIAEGMTFANLQQMKTPWGREYLGIAQSAGPSMWGVS